MSLKLQLDIRTVTDEMMALTALRSVTAPGQKNRGPLLTRNDLPALRVVVRMVFADILLALGSAVEESELDPADGAEENPYDEGEPMRLGVTLRTTGEVDSGRALAVKRQLEHAVAAGVLGWVASESDAGFSAHLASQRDAAIQAVGSALSATGSGAPFSVRGWP